MTAAETVVDALRHVTCGTPSTFRNLTVVPLVSGRAYEADYVVLDDALARGWVEVTELTDSGHVPELKVVNRGDAAVLLLDGEELVGAKQNRVLNLTLLAPPRHTSVIPVSCVESGRWHRTSPSFSSAPRTQFAEGRAARIQQVTASLREDGCRHSDQGAVWNSINLKAARLGAISDTAAMSAIYERLDRSLDAFVAAFPPVEGQVGAVFLLNGSFAGLELFDARATWCKLVPKLVRSYGLDAIDYHGQDAPAVSFELSSVIEQVRSSHFAVFSSVGEGEDVRLTGAAITGAALVARERVIHASVFPVH